MASVRRRACRSVESWSRPVRSSSVGDALAKSTKALHDLGEAHLRILERSGGDQAGEDDVIVIVEQDVEHRNDTSDGFGTHRSTYLFTNVVGAGRLVVELAPANALAVVTQYSFDVDICSV